MLRVLLDVAIKDLVHAPTEISGPLLRDHRHISLLCLILAIPVILIAVLIKFNFFVNNLIVKQAREIGYDPLG